tara:strand:+ start:59894 stop:60349 length:456 start_codon:yes stop_codon:yes gene_type:complete
MRILLSATILSFTAFGCGDSFEITDQPLQGQVGGASWSFVTGDTNAFLSDEDGYFATLFAADYETCGFSQAAGNSVILSIPTETGDYDLSLRRNMTFVVDDDDDGPQNLVATDGRIVVDEITATTITGGIHARFDGDNEIDGMFSVSVCPD